MENRLEQLLVESRRRQGGPEATAAVQFKIGEEIQIDGNLPPVLAHAVQATAKPRRAADTEQS